MHIELLHRSPMAFIFVINMHAVVAGIRTWDFLRHVHLSYHLTYTSLVMGREIFSFWSNPWMRLRCYQPVPKALKVPVGVTNQYLRLIHRHWLVVLSDTNVKVTTRYLRLIHRSHPPQKYRYIRKWTGIYFWGGPLACFLHVLYHNINVVILY